MQTSRRHQGPHDSRPSLWSAPTPGVPAEVSGKMCFPKSQEKAVEKHRPWRKGFRVFCCVSSLQALPHPPPHPSGAPPLPAVGTPVLPQEWGGEASSSQEPPTDAALHRCCPEFGLPPSLGVAVSCSSGCSRGDLQVPSPQPPAPHWPGLGPRQPRFPSASHAPFSCPMVDSQGPDCDPELGLLVLVASVPMCGAAAAWSWLWAG